MTTETRVKILEYVKKNGTARVCDLVYFLKIGNVAIHRQLKKMIGLGQLKKVGTVPKVYYHLADKL